jgi:hypothetical protein
MATAATPSETGRAAVPDTPPMQGAPGALAAAVAAAPDPDGSINDTLVLAGLYGVESEGRDLIETLRQAREEEIALENASYERDESTFRERIESVRRERADAKVRLQELAEAEQSARTQLEAARAQEIQSMSRVGTLLSSLLTRRAEYPLRLLARRIQDQAVLSESIRTQILDEERDRLAWEKEMHELTLQRRKANTEEFGRRLELLRQQRAQSESQLSEHEAYMRGLRRVGITRNVAGFLMWAGYLGFVGVGWFMGEALQSLHASQDGFLQTLATLFLRGLAALFGQVGPWVSIIFILLAPPLLLALLVGCVWGVDNFLARFDPAWKRRRSGLRGRSDNSFWTWINDPGRDVSRRDYVQIIAKLPSYYLWSMVPLLLAFLFSRTPAAVAAKLPDVSTSLLYTYFGVVICVLWAAFAILYCSRVMEPRVRRVVTEGVTGIMATLRVNGEIVVLLVLLTAVFVASDFFPPTSPATGPWSGARMLAPLLLSALTGLVVAYAMIYRGAFRDWDALKQEVGRYEDEMQKYSGAPLLVHDEDELSRFREELRQLREDLDAAWRRMDKADLPILQIPWDFGVELQVRDESRPAGPERPTIRLGPHDEYLAPEIVTQLTSAASERERHRREVAELRTRLDALLTETRTLSSIDWQGRLAGIRREWADRQALHRERLERIVHQRTEQIIGGLNALQAGMLLRRNTPAPASYLSPAGTDG